MVAAVANERWRLTLVHKALILVLIPFVFNCIWLVQLSSELTKSQRLVKMEREQSAFIEELNAVLQESYQTRENFMGYIASGAQSYIDKADTHISHTRQTLALMESRTDLSHEQKALVGELDEILTGQFKQIHDLVKETGRGTKLGVLKEIEPLTGQIDSVLDQYPNTGAHLAKQRHDLDSAREESATSAAHAGKMITYGFVGNLILTLLLVFAIRIGLAGRLSKLMEKSRRLPQRQALGAPIAGADELNDLDRSLHDAAGELVKASEFRSSLMQMVAHDLRSPLNSCLISVDILERGPENQERQLTAIKNNLGRVINLTGDLLFLEQFENAKLDLSCEPENIRELIDQAIGSVSGLASARQIEIKNESTRDYVLVDRERIIQVLVNYLSNAVKFTPAKASISVTSSVKKGFLSVFVKDSGGGVRPEDQHKIFERFFQAKEGRAAGGTGLGLAISKLIVEAHGGSVGVISEPGSGAIFWFSLPAPVEQS